MGKQGKSKVAANINQKEYLHKRDHPKVANSKTQQKEIAEKEVIEQIENCLYVSNITSEVRNQDVINLFKKQGKCSVEIQDHWDYAFVDYVSQADAQKAKKALHGYEVEKDCKLDVIYKYQIKQVKPKEKKNSKICKNFQNTGICNKNDCSLLHADVDDTVIQKQVLKKKDLHINQKKKADLASKILKKELDEEDKDKTQFMSKKKEKYEKRYVASMVPGIEGGIQQNEIKYEEEFQPLKACAQPVMASVEPEKIRNLEEYLFDKTEELKKTEDTSSLEDWVSYDSCSDEDNCMTGRTGIWECDPEWAISHYLNSIEENMINMGVRGRKFDIYKKPEIPEEEKLMNQELQVNMKKVCKDLMIIEQMQTKFYGKEKRSTKKTISDVVHNATKNSSSNTNDLDLMFIMDCTASMGSYINSCKRDINEIVKIIKEENGGVKVRLSFVGYRDFDCGKTALSELEFTSDVDKFKSFMNGVSARGGGDAAEDMCSGFESALKKSWNLNSTKVGVIITDAPCHGGKYQPNIYSSDDYKNGDPQNRDIEKQIKDIASLGVDLYGIKCNSSTDNMFRIFNMSYKQICHKEIQISSLGDAVALVGKNEKGILSNNGRTANSAFSTFICNSATQSLSQRYSATGDSGSGNKKADKLIQDFLILLANKESLKNPQRLDDIILQISKLNGLTKESAAQLSEAHIYLKDEISGLKNQQRILHMSRKVENTNMMKVDSKVTAEAKKLMVEKDSFNIQGAMIVKAHNFYIVQDSESKMINWKNPVIESSTMKSQVKINCDAFSEGAYRYAYQGYDTILNQDLVLKCMKEINLDQYNVENMSQDLELVAICNLIVNQFNERVIDSVTKPDLLRDFVRPFIFEILDNKQNQFWFNKEGSHMKNDKLKYFYAENYIEGDYVKQNNNGGWMSDSSSDEALIAQALSHFSWQITRGYMIMVDIQGVGNVLTDPVIHCLDKQRFDSSNFGYEGILKFFQTHQCNHYCSQLGLMHPRESGKLPKGFSFFSQEKSNPMPHNEFQKIFKLCDLCKNSFETTLGEFYDNTKYGRNIWCSNCHLSDKSTKFEHKCTDCEAPIKNSMHWYKMMRMDPFDQCKTCRKVKSSQRVQQVNN